MIGLGLTGLATHRSCWGVTTVLPPARLAAQAMRAGSAMRPIGIGTWHAKSAFPILIVRHPRAFIRTLPDDIRDAIAGIIRNSHLTAIAPTGTISPLAGQYSSGVEPVFDPPRHSRRLLMSMAVTWCSMSRITYMHCGGEITCRGAVAAGFRQRPGMEPPDHFGDAGRLQPFVDSAISKTVNVPEDYPLTNLCNLYGLAYRGG